LAQGGHDWSLTEPIIARSVKMKSQAPFWDSQVGMPTTPRQWDPLSPGPVEESPPMFGSFFGRREDPEAQYEEQRLLDEQYKRLQMHEQSPQRHIFNTKAAQDYGASDPKKKTRRKTKAAKESWSDKFQVRLRGTVTDAQTIVAGGTAVFILTICLYNFGLFRHSQAVFDATVAMLACCGLLVYLEGKRFFYLVFCFSCTAAIFSGALVGTYSYDNFGYFSYMLSNLRLYDNVLPSEPTDMVTDGGRINFAKEARLDQGRPVGFAAEDGHVYCAAPIVSAAVDIQKVEFWAVGKDCCELQGSFTCDAAGEPSARGGIIMLDGAGGVFSSSYRDQYDDARRKAQAIHGFQAATSPLYLRWATKEQMSSLTHTYDNEAAIFLVVATAIYFGIVTTFAWAMAKRPMGKDFDAPVPEI